METRKGIFRDALNSVTCYIVFYRHRLKSLLVVVALPIRLRHTITTCSVPLPSSGWNLTFGTVQKGQYPRQAIGSWGTQALSGNH